jgi:hypothetical protein
MGKADAGERGEAKKWELGREAMPVRLGDERWQGKGRRAIPPFKFKRRQKTIKPFLFSPDTRQHA